MHHALQIEEILLNIFGHCRRRCNADLPALARTCRTFKEPALSVLWEELEELSPLARCLPEACHLAVRDYSKCYSFSRPLTETEWAILRGYTRYILSIRDDWYYPRGPDWESVRTFLNPPTTEPLFPNLRHLYCGSATRSANLLSMPFPSLITLAVQLKEDEGPYALQNSLESLSRISSNIRNLIIKSYGPHIMFSNFLSSCICKWRSLRRIDCPNITFNRDALAHLSHMPALTYLIFTLSDTLPDQIASSDSPLYFSNMHHFTLYSKFLGPISRLLPKIRLPAIVALAAFIEICPSKSDVSSFFTGIQTSSPSHTIQKLWLINRIRTGDPRPVLRFEDLQPCMGLSNLRDMEFDIEWNVDLTDDGLLALASAWPRLESLTINPEWGWNTPGGITPDGILQLLQTCRSLSYIGLAIDTRGYTKLHRSPASLGLTFSTEFVFDVLDSRIEVESVSAVAAFLDGFQPGCFDAWQGRHVNNTVYSARWDDVDKQTSLFRIVL